MNTQKYSGEGRTFARYVSQNILSMIGMSCYIMVDTYFISKAAGADGITVLNLTLPIYSIIYGLGELIGTGASVYYAVSRSADRERYFAQSILWILLIGGLISVICQPNTSRILRLMGGDPGIVALGTPYLSIVFCYTIFFMANFAFLGFIRNDGAPGLCMVATIASSIFNMIFDYVFMFLMKMGLRGAALATAISPIISMLICSMHFLKKENAIRFKPGRMSVRIFIKSLRLGISACVTEMATSVTTAVFNFLVLGLRGNIGVAAYGVVANYAIIANSFFNGIAQGSQPLISRNYTKGDEGALRRTIFRALATALSIAALLYLGVWAGTDWLVALFNSEGREDLAGMAFVGMRIYFVGFFFSGFNIVMASSLNARNESRPAAIISLGRGVVFIVVCAFLLSHLFGMTGIWMAFPAAEILTFVLVLVLTRDRKV